MRIARTIITSFLVAGCLFCLCGTGYSQGTNLGTIRGTVTDPNGAVIPHASVQITDQATGISRDLITDNEGNYEANALKPGNYKVTVTASGFKTTVMDAVVKGSDVVRADFKTEIGAQSENVTVSGVEAGLIEKEQPVIAGTLNNRQLIEVPRDSRDIYEFLYLNPDITQETIGELTVLSKNFTDEYSGIANIRVETKRGGREYHGSLFYNNKNSALAAVRVQDKMRPQLSFPPQILQASQYPSLTLMRRVGI